MTTETLMKDMLTAREIQDLFQVDRSTVYRMAEDGRLPAIKVGKQWRFPAKQINSWFQVQLTTSTVPTVRPPGQGLQENKRQELAELLSWDWLKIIQDTFADLLGVMIVVTGMDGVPINQPSRACGLFDAISQQPGTMQIFVQAWRRQATTLDLAPSFRIGHLGLLCARSMIAVGSEIKGAVLAGCIAPPKWPPKPASVSNLASQFGVASDFFTHHLSEVYHLDSAQQDRVLATLPRIASLIAHIVDERKVLVDRLEAIANLSRQVQLDPQYPTLSARLSE